MFKSCFYFSDPPKVTVKLDSEVEFPVKEKTAVKLKCEIAARPSASSVSWFFNVSTRPNEFSLNLEKSSQNLPNFFLLNNIWEVFDRLNVNVTFDNLHRLLKYENQN